MKNVKNASDVYKAVLGLVIGNKMLHKMSIDQIYLYRIFFIDARNI